MCGRMIVLTYDEVREVLRFVRAGAQNPYPDWPAQAPRDAFPQDEVPIVVPDETGELAAAEPQVLRWGYPVDWQPNPVFNTRVESMMRDYGMWSESAGSRRCLVPTRGFYERHGSQKERSRKTGRLVIPMDFKEAGNFENGKADVTTENNKAAVIDKTGKIIK